MAELTTTSDNRNVKKSRSQKALPRVDLTAMVDLAFLLITFFMLTTTLAKQNAMEVAMPVGELPGTVPDDRALTVCIGSDDNAVTYLGTTEKPEKERASKVNKIRAGLLEDIKFIEQRSGKGAIVLIKPSEKSNFKNLVDVLDEMAITKVGTYAIADIVKTDLEILRKQNAY